MPWGADRARAELPLVVVAEGPDGAVLLERQAVELASGDVGHAREVAHPLGRERVRRRRTEAELQVSVEAPGVHRAVSLDRERVPAAPVKAVDAGEGPLLGACAGARPAGRAARGPPATAKTRRRLIRMPGPRRDAPAPVDCQAATPMRCFESQLGDRLRDARRVHQRQGVLGVLELELLGLRAPSRWRISCTFWARSGLCTPRIESTGCLMRRASSGVKLQAYAAGISTCRNVSASRTAWSNSPVVREPVEHLAEGAAGARLEERLQRSAPVAGLEDLVDAGHPVAEVLLRLRRGLGRRLRLGDRTHQRRLEQDERVDHARVVEGELHPDDAAERVARPRACARRRARPAAPVRRRPDRSICALPSGCSLPAKPAAVVVDHLVVVRERGLAQQRGVLVGQQPAVQQQYGLARATHLVLELTPSTRARSIYPS